MIHVREKRILLSLVCVCLVNSLVFGQYDQRLNPAEKSIDFCDEQSESKLVIYGEMHFHPEESIIVQRNIFERLLVKRNKNLTLFLELSPACAYFGNRYLETGDSKWLTLTESVRSYKEFFNYLFSIKDTVKLVIKGIDLEPKGYFNQVRFFLKQFIKDSMSDFSHKMNRVKSRKRFLKVLKNEIERNGCAEFKFNSITDSIYFIDEMQVLLGYGFISGSYLVNNDRLREGNMIQVIKKYFNSNGLNFLNIGRAHVTPNNVDGTLPNLLAGLDWLTRKEMMIVTRIYYNSYGIFMGRKPYHTTEELNELIQKGIFDCIVSDLKVFD